MRRDRFRVAPGKTEVNQDMTIGKKFYNFGCRLSTIGANLAGHPLAITLTRMVLNQQRRTKAALHIKTDELILAAAGARNELAGIESKTEDELEALRQDSPGCVA